MAKQNLDVINPLLNDYLQDLLPERDPVLTEMEAYARKHRFPIIGPLCGTLLCQLALLSGARRILEMGSGYGYSAYWFRKGMTDDGIIICTDGEAENRKKALVYHERGEFASQLEFRVGDAREIIKDFDGPFDIIFNDVDKEQYPDTLDPALSHLRSGGLFITDNTLWSGRVVLDDDAASTRGVREFNRRLFADHSVIASIIPLRDGLSLAVKR